MSQNLLAGWMRDRQQHIEQVLDAALPAARIAPERLHAAMRYATLGGGKRIRSLLAYAAGELGRPEPAALDAVAAAVELVHAYSLVHDDLPCMDDDVLRRGKPTVHVEFDEATALLVGDALQTLAFQLLAEPIEGMPTELCVEMILLLARASGSRGMAGGQALDLAAVGHSLSREELEVMHLHKTGALIRAAVMMGALAARLDTPALEAIDRFGKSVGLLFQVVDDVLDAEADTATLGKTAGKDAAHDKPTYVTVLGLAEAKRLAAELRAQAHDALGRLGAASTRLAQLTDFIVDRSF